jgi:hypothetical protein
MIAASLRTKSIAESIHRLSEEGVVRVVDYQPGNGTRYTLIITRVHESQALGILGFPEDEGCYHVYLMGVGTLLLSPYGLLHWNYVREKLHCGVADAVVLAEFLGHLLGRPHVTCEQYLKNA